MHFRTRLVSLSVNFLGAHCWDKWVHCWKIACSKNACSQEIQQCGDEMRANYTYSKACCRRPIFLCKSPFKEWFFYRETKRPVRNIRWKNGDKILNIINTFRQLWLVLFIMLHIIITLTKTPTFNENMIFFSLKCVVNKKKMSSVNWPATFCGPYVDQ